MCIQRVHEHRRTASHGGYAAHTPAWIQWIARSHHLTACGIPQREQHGGHAQARPGPEQRHARARSAGVHGQGRRRAGAPEQGRHQVPVDQGGGRAGDEARGQVHCAGEADRVGGAGRGDGGAQRQADPRAVAQPAGPERQEGGVVGRGGPDPHGRARQVPEQVGGDRAAAPGPHRQRHQEPLELHPQAPRRARRRQLPHPHLLLLRVLLRLVPAQEPALLGVGEEAAHVDRADALLGALLGLLARAQPLRGDQRQLRRLHIGVSVAVRGGGGALRGAERAARGRGGGGAGVGAAALAAALWDRGGGVRHARLPLPPRGRGAARVGRHAHRPGRRRRHGRGLRPRHGGFP
mmetsp:Transcript_34300/g.80908  ORF Transcript_34300/g.80908 Transcript_34300/m.80908 type:complete len:350 (+) Transcript_34300:774-1823(+)